MPDSRFTDYIKGGDWIQKYVFPGGCLPSLFELQRAVRHNTALELQDVEEIGSHYAPTLRLWRERLRKNVERVRELGFDDSFTRIWEFYLASCEAAFAIGHTRDLQLVLRA